MILQQEYLAGTQPHAARPNWKRTALLIVTEGHSDQATVDRDVRRPPANPVARPRAKTFD